MIESWMISMGIAATGAISTYAVLRSRVSRLEVDLESHAKKDDEQHEKELKQHSDTYRDLLIKSDTIFKKNDILSEKITILERDTSTHLDMQKADERFVSKVELALQLKNITTTTEHTDKTVEVLGGNIEKIQDAVFQILHNQKKED